MKPEIKINLNIDLNYLDSLPLTDCLTKIRKIISIARWTTEESIKSVEPAPPTSLPKGKAPPPPPAPSRHYQAVAANQRISEAVEQINKLKALYPDNVEFHQILNSIKQVLLGT